MSVRDSQVGHHRLGGLHLGLHALSKSIIGAFQAALYKYRYGDPQTSC